MRYDAAHKAETRARVVQAAARAIRAHGPFKAAVAAIMADAGLTHGGFYAHFRSKDDLLAAAVLRMFEDGRRSLERGTGEPAASTTLGAYIDAYLSERHRDARGSGCPLPVLAADAPRLPNAVRAAYGQGVSDLTARLSRRLAALGRPDPDVDARRLLSEMVGALSLARADPDRQRSAAILTASREALKARFSRLPPP